MSAGNEQSGYLPKRQPEKTARSLTALYLLDRLGPVTDKALLTFLVEAEIMDYFELMPALLGLCREGQAVRTEEGTAWVYEITPAGKETLHLFLSRMVPSLHDRLDSLIPSWKDRLRVRQTFDSAMRQTERGDYEVTLRLNDHGMELLSLRALVPSAELADRMKRNWETEGTSVYQTVLSLVREDKQ